jgi:hypothetical protein
VLIPALVSSLKKYKTDTTLYADLAEPIAVFKKWDYYANENSVATTLANEWGFILDPIIRKTYIKR